MEKTYNKISERIKKLKNKMNTLEHTLSQGSSSKNSKCMKALNSTTESTNRLSDSLIAESKKAWKTHGKLERKCKATGSELTKLDPVRVWCVKTEGMAADLLCYSLGHLKHKAQTKEER